MDPFPVTFLLGVGKMLKILWRKKLYSYTRRKKIAFFLIMSAKNVSFIWTAPLIFFKGVYQLSILIFDGSRTIWGYLLDILSSSKGLLSIWVILWYLMVQEQYGDIYGTLYQAQRVYYQWVIFWYLNWTKDLCN